MQVCVAHTGAVHLDETLSQGELLWLLHWMVILDKDGGIGGYDKSSLLGFRYANASRHYRRRPRVVLEVLVIVKKAKQFIREPFIASSMHQLNGSAGQLGSCAEWHVTL